MPQGTKAVLCSYLLPTVTKLYKKDEHACALVYKLKCNALRH